MFVFTVAVFFRRQADNGTTDHPIFTAVVDVMADNDTDATLVAIQQATAIRHHLGVMPVGHRILDMIA